jgi:exonuclease-1
MQVGTKVPPDYMEEFQRANLTFKHQRVFCPERECLVMWNEPDDPLPDETLVYIGAYLIPSSSHRANSSDLNEEIARGVARGELHPMTKAPLGSASQDKENIKVLPFPPPNSTELWVAIAVSSVHIVI